MTNTPTPEPVCYGACGRSAIAHVHHGDRIHALDVRDPRGRPGFVPVPVPTMHGPACCDHPHDHKPSDHLTYAEVEPTVRAIMARRAVR